MAKPINTRALGVAAAAIAATLSALCSLMVALAPDAARTLTGWFFHADVSELRWAVTWTSFLARLVGAALVAGVAAAGVAAVYNASLGQSGMGEPR